MTIMFKSLKLLLFAIKKKGQDGLFLPNISFIYLFIISFLSRYSYKY